ncbi:hypothetical protein D3C81_1888260 [compost metagenome]
MSLTMVASCAAVALASPAMRANTPWKSPSIRAPRRPSAMARSMAETSPRFCSVVCIKRFRPSTIARKSCSKRALSPRWLKSPAAAASARRRISPLIAPRLDFTASSASVITAFSPGRRSMSRLRSPTA